MYTMFMNSKNSKTSKPHRLLLNLADKVNLKRNDKYDALSNLSMNYTWKNIKKIINLIYLVNFISFKYILKKHGEITNNPSIRIYT